MSRIWVDDDEPTRDQISTKRALLIIAVIVVALLLVTSCGIESMESIELPASPSLDMEVCQNVITDPDIMLSDLIPTNWESWCDGFIGMYAEMDAAAESETAPMCTWFWDQSDAFIQQEMVDRGFSPNEAIGGVDALWVFCG